MLAAGIGKTVPTSRGGWLGWTAGREQPL